MGDSKLNIKNLLGDCCCCCFYYCCVANNELLSLSREQYLWWWCEGDPTKIAVGRNWRRCCLLMQRIFPNVSPTFLMREGICYKDHAISELGIYGAYLRYLLSYNKINERHNFLVCQSLILGIYTMLNGIHQTASLIPHVECTWPFHLVLRIGMCRNKEKVIINDQCSCLMRTKVSSSNEGGVAVGFAVLDSIYLTWLKHLTKWLQLFRY